MSRKPQKIPKISEENRAFKPAWTVDYFFIEFNKSPLCLICKKSLSCFKVENIRRHYETNHSEFKELSVTERIQRTNMLKSSLIKQQQHLQQANTANNGLLKASQKISYLIAKQMKSFTNGELVKKSIEHFMEEVCPDKVKFVSQLALSPQTVVRRIDNISTKVYKNLSDIASSFKYYYIALDSSNDNKDTDQLLIFIRGLTQDFTLVEELCSMRNIKGTTKGADLFSEVEKSLDCLKIPWSKLFSVTTDGAPNMEGKDKGVVALIKKKCLKSSNHSPISVHCIIHQQALCSTVMIWKSHFSVLSSVISFVKQHGLRHREFQEFLKQCDSEYSDVVYYTPIRWLSCGNALKRYYLLHKEISLFLESKGQRCSQLSDENWLWGLVFLVDITSLLNHLNKKLQGHGNLITDLYSEIKAFESKLRLLSSHAYESNMYHFPTCLEYSKLAKTPFPAVQFHTEIIKLGNEFGRRFQELKENNDLLNLFRNPFNIDLSTQRLNFQMELADLQNNENYKDCFKELPLLEFYKTLPKKEFPELHDLAFKFGTMFGSTYICEQAFSKMGLTKSVFRANITDANLEHCMRILTSSFEPDFDKLLQSS